MENKKVTVAVLGASSEPERYSYKAISFLLEKGLKVIPVSIRNKTIQGLSCVPSLNDININDNVDTLTIYVNPKISDTQLESIIKLNPRRVIFNPGTENENLASALEKAGIEVLEACTLVLLRTGQF